MKAHILNSYGADTLFLGDIEEPTAGPGQVKVRVEAIGINPVDWKIRNGFLADMIPLRLPAVIGTDIAGTVVDLGAGVAGFAIGDRVVGFADSGAFAEFAVTRAARLALIPEALATERAVTLATSAETALRGLNLLAPDPESTLVVNGAAGAVGSAVVQILVADGHTVIGTAGTANFDYVRSLGAIPVTYGATMLDEIIAAAHQGVNAAFDTAGRGFIGRMAGLVPATRTVTITDFAAAASGAIVAGGDPTALTAETIAPVLDLASRGSFRTEIARLFPFEQLPQALALSQAGHLRGKIIVTGPNTH
ncbi:NADPH:quinone reductase-like Zn-dependent oxidoreductase [Arthrobacter sp. V4I6]|uniref:NADP-dependent oxidoreductase n=1 Tax=unclassified Arthrobacter TaxID=235627 RepID=UPI0027869008|nr:MULTISPECIES: NADP-dependent oxidoreductase [unclassified Arthrobacter]MDQ0821467.1 NADPH:quinone reductase-like Zn-dependent oxidoreductase [Arthrobacter sp. V1I7]MDQ0855733.1 NADPH:quinone reductase-like Zn-dependent oxidoreductase [Arthrobacter sp. V4I6]